MAFEVPAMHSLLFTAMTLVQLVGFLRFHLLNQVGHHIKSKVVSETQKGLDHHVHTKIADAFPQNVSCYSTDFYVNLLVNNLKRPVYFLIKRKDINWLSVPNVTYSCPEQMLEILSGRLDQNKFYE